MATDAPYLGIGCSSPYTRKELLVRELWRFVQATLFRFSPRPCHRFRASLLKLFGASIEHTGKVVVFPTARITIPKNLTLEERSMIGPNVTVYNLARIHIKRGANISQNCHLCAGTHDFTRWEMPLVAKPIVICENAWVAADVFVGPGVEIGELTVIGARSVVVRSIPPRTVAAGNPCRVLHSRSEPH